MGNADNTGKRSDGTSRRRLARTCGARLRGGRFCKLAAGHNTDHPGIGLCYKHGGNSERELKRAGIQMAHEGIMDPDIHPGDIVELEPHNALLWSVMIAGGDTAYWNQQLKEIGQLLQSAEADDDEVLEKELRRRLKEAFHELRAANRDMRSAGKMAIEAGLQERQVVMAERMAGLLANFARSLLARLDLPPEIEAQLPTIIHEEIMTLEQPGMEVKPKPKMALTAHKKSDLFYED